MKKLLFTAFVVSLCCWYSCKDKEDDDHSKGQKNIESTRVITEAFRTGDISKIDDVVANDYVDHTDRGDMNRDSLKTMITMIKKEFPDMKADIIKELADEDHAFTWMRISGNSNGAMGMPVGPYDMQAIQAYKFKDGKISEHWEFMNMVDMSKMMSQMESSGNMNVDTVKKK